MHTFTPEWPNDLATYEPPSLFDFTYRDATDIGKYAAREPLAAWYTRPEAWHLDGRGLWRCCSKGSSLDSVRRYAAHPERMVECRLVKPRRRCPNNWVMLEPRHPWSDRYEVTEGDAEAFVRLRAGLVEFGVNLLDVVVFDQECHWWSLYELTTGSTEWVFRP